MPTTILVDRQDHVLTITLNRPDKLNAFNHVMFQELYDAVMAGDRDSSVRCVIITGAGRAFSAGADIAAFKAAVEENKRTGIHTASAVDQVLLERFSDEIGKTSVPIIAAINGPALGLGFTLTIGCDIRFISDKATMGAVFARMGLTPEFGSTYNLVRLVGIATACELVFNAKVVTAQEAKDLRLVNHVVPHDELMPKAMAMAKNIASFSPTAIRLAKKNLYAGLDSTRATQAHLEIWANRIARATPDHEEAVNAFLEKRAPVFR